MTKNWDLTVMTVYGLSRMKFVAAYLLAVLAGNPSPSAEDLSAILESGKMFHFKDRNGSYVSLTISSAFLTKKNMPAH
jgi:hypothetical protein